jgi:hypothetical protein
MKSNYCVVGRVPDGDDEAHCFEQVTRQEAIALFINELYDGDQERIEAARAETGDAVYIEFILRSDSPIHNNG